MGEAENRRDKVELGVALNITITNTTTVIGIALQPWYEAYIPQLISVFGTLVGLVAGHRLGSVRARNERLYEGIYKPLQAQIGAVVDEVERGLDLDLGPIKVIQRDPLFLFLKEKERIAVDRVYRRMGLYSWAYQSAVAAGQDIIKDEMKRQFLGDIKYANLIKQVAQGRLPTYRFLVGGKSREQISLLDSLVQKKSPCSVLGVTAIISTGRNYDCILGSDEIPEHKAKTLSESVLKTAEENGHFKLLWSARRQLVEDINSLVGMLKRHI